MIFTDRFCTNLSSDVEIDDNFLAERKVVVSQLVSGKMKSAIKSCRRFIHNYWNKYYPISVGDLKLQGVNDISCHVAAMDDVLSEWLDAKQDCYNKKKDFLKKYIATYGDYRIPHVLLALEYLKKKEYKNAIEWALAACAIDERCMPSWQILKISYLELVKLDQLDQCLSKEQIKHLEPLGYDLRGKICPLAFDRIFVQSNGEVMCCCPPLVPVAIGNVFKNFKWREIINSPSAREIRESIIEGSYKYCNRLTCQEIRNINNNTFLVSVKNLSLSSNEDDLLNRAKNDSIDSLVNYSRNNNNLSTIGNLNLGFDETCNLHCPQCRRGFIPLTKQKKKHLEHLSKNIIPDMIMSSRKIMLANTGDPFASKYYYQILKSLSSDTHKHLNSITIFTNGLLFNQKKWKELENLHTFDIGVAVSVDAMTKNTYNEVRPPGNWEILLENLRFISSLKKNDKIKYFEVEFVIQECNFKEMVDFTVWALKDLHVSRVAFHRLINTGTYTDVDYKTRAIFNEKHPRHLELLQILKNPIFLHEKVHFTDLAYLVNKAMYNQK